jgi:hypothetical protein
MHRRIEFDPLVTGIRPRGSQASILPSNWAAPHYGLRYGSASATGDFQLLRGRPPLVSLLKSCMGRSFTGLPSRRLGSKTVVS